MSFFDSKQEVINIELTQYGKYLISKGKFKPVYYAFFDDDVVYDASYIKISESQNNSQTRILDETPINKPNYVFSSVQETALNQSELIKAENIEGLIELEKEIVSSVETNQNMLLPLGKSSYNSSFSPSWSFTLFSGSIMNASQFIDNSLDNDIYAQPFLRLPQINLVTGSYILRAINKMADMRQGEELIGQVNAADETYLIANKQNIKNIIDIIENNTDDDKENFEIEVFIEKEKILLNGNRKKIWEQLYFFKKPTNIKNNILLDNYLYQEAEYKRPSETNVEFYFEFLVDEEIQLPENAKKAIGIYETNIGIEDKPFGENC